MINEQQLLTGQMNMKKLDIGWFHRYPARFSSETLIFLFSHVFNKLGRVPINILDPFAGTGSCLSFAKQLGITSYGKELTKLGKLICDVRLNPPDDLERVLNIARELSFSKVPKSNKCIVHNIELIKWIGEDNHNKLNYLLDKINQNNDPRERDWLLLALSSSLRPSSCWLAGSIKPQIDPNREYSNLQDHFWRVSRTLKKDCEKEKMRFQRGCLTSIYQGDSRSLHEFKDSSIEAIITSPPYGSMYDYFDVHRLTYLAFSWDRFDDSQIGRSTRIQKINYAYSPPSHMYDWYYYEFKEEKTSDGRALREYFERMQDHFRESHRILREGGIIAYAVANSMKKGKRFPIVESLAELIEETGFVEVEIIPRSQTMKRILPAGRDPKTGRFNSSTKPAVQEFIIIARKR